MMTTEALLFASLAAVAKYGAGALERRRAPEVSAASTAAITESVAALSEIREMAEPEAKRGPRGETGETSGGGAGVTEASDRAHLEWQLRRVLLFARRGVAPTVTRGCGGNSDDEAVVCNALCGAALVQGSVDAEGGSVGDGATWALEVLSGIDAADAAESAGGAATPEPTQSRCEALLLLVELARGHMEVAELPRPKTAPKTNSVAATRDMAATRGGDHAHGTDARVTPSRGAARAHSSRLHEWLEHDRELNLAATNLRALPHDLRRFMDGLPGSMRMTPPTTTTNLLIHSRATTRAPFINAGELYGNAVAHSLRHVVAVVNPIRFKNSFVVILQDLRGRPLHVSKVFPTSTEAFHSMINDLAYPSPPAWLDHLRPGTLIFGVSMAPAQMACVAQGPVSWLARISAPTYRVRDVLLDAFTPRAVDLPPSTRALEFQNFRVALMLAGEYADACVDTYNSRRD